MAGQPTDEVSGIEALHQNLVEQEQAGLHLALEEMIHKAEIVLGAEHIQVLADKVVGEVASREAHHLVKDGQRIAHTAVSLLGNEVQGLGLGRITLLLGHILEMLHHALNGHALEVVHLTAAQDGGQDLVLLGGGQDEDDVRGRFLQRLQERIEGGTREHVHLVDDEHLVATYLRRNLHLLDQLADVLHRVVAGGIQFVDAHRALFVEGLAALTLSAGLSFGRRCQAVDGLGKDAGTRRLTHSARPAEEVGMSQLTRRDGILQRRGQRTLPHDGIKRQWPVFSRRYYIFFHTLLSVLSPLIRGFISIFPANLRRLFHNTKPRGDFFFPPQVATVPATYFSCSDRVAIS